MQFLTENQGQYTISDQPEQERDLSLLNRSRDRAWVTAGDCHRLVPRYRRLSNFIYRLAVRAWKPVRVRRPGVWYRHGWQRYRWNYIWRDVGSVPVSGTTGPGRSSGKITNAAPHVSNKPLFSTRASPRIVIWDGRAHMAEGTPCPLILGVGVLIRPVGGRTDYPSDSPTEY